MTLTCSVKDRAGDGNRTRMTSLEGWGSTIELHPRDGRLDTGDRPTVAYRLAPRSRTASAPGTPRMRQVMLQNGGVVPRPGEVLMTRGAASAG